jgi:hypothetical protein
VCTFSTYSSIEILVIWAYLGGWPDSPATLVGYNSPVWCTWPNLGACAARNLKQLGPALRKTNPDFVFSRAGSFEHVVHSYERYGYLHRCYALVPGGLGRRHGAAARAAGTRRRRKRRRRATLPAQAAFGRVGTAPHSTTASMTSSRPSRSTSAPRVGPRVGRVCHRPRSQT